MPDLPIVYALLHVCFWIILLVVQILSFHYEPTEILDFEGDFRRVPKSIGLIHRSDDDGYFNFVAFWCTLALMIGVGLKI